MTNQVPLKDIPSKYLHPGIRTSHNGKDGRILEVFRSLDDTPTGILIQEGFNGKGVYLDQSNSDGFFAVLYQLRTVPWELIEVGQGVISVIGNPGVITGKFEEDDIRSGFRGDRGLSVQWDNGKKSHLWYHEGKILIVL